LWSLKNTAKEAEKPKQGGKHLQFRQKRGKPMLLLLSRMIYGPNKLTDTTRRTSDKSAGSKNKRDTPPLTTPQKQMV